MRIRTMASSNELLAEPLAKLLASTAFEIAENPNLVIRRALSKLRICERASIGHDSRILQEAHVPTMHNSTIVNVAPLHDTTMA
jgi:hypothetical protein